MSCVVCVRVRACVCVCVRARARVCVYVCVCVNMHTASLTRRDQVPACPIPEIVEDSIPVFLSHLGMDVKTRIS